ncbi:Acyltransferase [Teratosphaeria destructans]|uniref:Acyltransferase n=1 Tax=Teratosphaeria destructans TaxID=418781 RepID=A0A9W7W2Y2_9PEZI|nr:Acyltransferase [Teratosphaeria destructans]
MASTKIIEDGILKDYAAVSDADIPPIPTLPAVRDRGPHDRPCEGHTKASLLSRHSSATSHLDGLRGLAATFVFIQHLVGGFDLNVHERGFGENGNYYLASLPFIRLIFSGGSAAVTVFFVLSGYVLAKSPLTVLRDGKQSTLNKGLLSSVVRRPFRLYLPVIAITGLTAVLVQFPTIMPSVAFVKALPSFEEQLGHWFRETVKYLWPFQAHSPYYPYSQVIWTIPEELKGSLLIYFCTALYSWVFHRRAPNVVVPVLFAAAVVLLLAFGKWDNACFLAGMAVCHWDVFWHNEGNLLPLSVTDGLSVNVKRAARKYRAYAMTVLSLYLLSQPARSGDPVSSSQAPGYKTLHRLIPSAYSDWDYYRYWHSYGSILLLYSLLSLDATSPIRTFLTSRPLLYLGRISFMLYLVHIPVFGTLAGRVGAMFGNVSLGSPPSFWNDRLWIPDIGPAGCSSRFIASVAVLLPITIGVAELGTRYIDRPSITVGKRLAQRLGLEARQTVPSTADVKTTA